MERTNGIQEHMEVLGADGKHVGMVDHVDGDRIKLTKNDPNAGGQHHFIPIGWVDRVDANAVRLNRASDEAMRDWQTAT